MVEQLRNRLQQKFQQPSPDAVKIAVRLPDERKIEYNFNPSDVTKVGLLFN